MPEIDLLIDATEKERKKPKGKQEKERYYSGRKKRQTIKSQVVVERGKGLIMDVSRGWRGSIHDLKVFDRSEVVRKFSCFKVKGWTDKGYEGIEGLAKGWVIEQPKKKPRGRELTEEEKGRDKEINKERIGVEHKILVSGCFRTKYGARVYARLQGVISTCRKQDRNVFLTLRSLFAHQPVSLLAGG